MLLTLLAVYAPLPINNNLGKWAAAESYALDAIYSVHGVQGLLNGQAVTVILNKEQSNLGDYAAVSADFRWRMYVRTSEVEALNRLDELQIDTANYLVDSTVFDDGYELSAWLSEVSYG